MVVILWFLGICPFTSPLSKLPLNCSTINNQQVALSAPPFLNTSEYSLISKQFLSLFVNHFVCWRTLQLCFEKFYRYSWCHLLLYLFCKRIQQQHKPSKYPPSSRKVFLKVKKWPGLWGGQSACYENQTLLSLQVFVRYYNTLDKYKLWCGCVSAPLLSFIITLTAPVWYTEDPSDLLFSFKWVEWHHLSLKKAQGDSIFHSKLEQHSLWSHANNSPLWAICHLIYIPLAV